MSTGAWVARRLPENGLFLFCPSFSLSGPWGLLPCPPQACDPQPLCIPQSLGLQPVTASLCLFQPGEPESFITLVSRTRHCGHRAVPISQAGWRAPGLEGQARESRRGCRGESRFSYPTRRCLVQSSWTGASGPREQQEWVEPVGGTDIWQGRGSQAWSLWGLRGWGKGRVSGSVAVGGVGVG